MDILLQQIVNGLVQGSIYALVALGYTMVHGIMGLINFAHGEVVMIGTLVALSVAGLLLQLGMPAAVAGFGGLAAATVVCMALGWGLERVAYRPLRHAPRLTPLITAIGMSIVLQNVAMLVWGAITSPSGGGPKAQFEVAGAHFTAVQVMIVVVSGLTMVGLLLLVYRTRLGMAMRATAQNPAVAGLMGVNVDRVIAAAFVIGSALGAVAGMLVGAYYEIAHYQMGFMLGLKAFTAAVLGESATSPGRWPAGSSWGSSKPWGRATSAISPAVPGQQLPGHLRLPGAHRRPHVPPVGTVRGKDRETGRDALPGWRLGPSPGSS